MFLQMELWKQLKAKVVFKAMHLWTFLQFHVLRSPSMCHPSSFIHLLSPFEAFLLLHFYRVFPLLHILCVSARAIAVSKCVTRLSVLVPYLGLRVQGSLGSGGSMNDCLLSGGKQKNVCVCMCLCEFACVLKCTYLRETNRKHRFAEWMTERKTV